MTKWDDFKVTNRFRRFNRLMQIILSLSLVAGLNYLAGRHFVRGDLTSRHLFSLSPETKAYLRQLERPVKIIVTIPPDSPHEEESILYRYTHDLLQEYAYAAGDKIVLEFVDIYREPKRANELAQTCHLDQPDLVIFISGDRQRFVVPAEIMEFKDKVVPVSFRGEQVFTSTLLEVAQRRKPKIYFTVGHGEMRLDDVDPMAGLSQIASELKLRNFTTVPLDLNQVKQLPADADLVIVPAPQGPLEAEEVEKLRNYLAERAGRVIVLLAPGRPHGLDDLFYDWGILADDMVVLEPGSDYKETSGSLLIRQFADHPVTKILIENQTPVATGLCRPVRIDPGAKPDASLTVTQLMGSSPGSWAEHAYRDTGPAVYNPEYDLKGPVSIAVVAERKSSSQLGINVSGGRLIVFGCGDLISNRRISSQGNYSLFLSTINWTLERDRLLAIQPRPIENYQLTLSRRELMRVVWALLSLPGGTAFLGLIIYWLRNR